MDPDKAFFAAQQTCPVCFNAEGQRCRECNGVDCGATDAWRETKEALWRLPTEDAYNRACRALHWRTAELRAHGIEPIAIPEDAPLYPPDDFDFGAGDVTIGAIKTVLRAKLDLSDELLADMEDNLTAVAVAVLLAARPAQGMSAGTAETPQEAQGRSPASPVGEADAPNPSADQDHTIPKGDTQ